MNARERKQEEQELQQAVNVMRAAIRSIAHRKAKRYEQEFLHRVLDMINEEIGANAEASKYMHEYVAGEVKREIEKQWIMKARLAQKIVKRAFNITKRESRLMHDRLKFPYWNVQSLHRDHRITKAISITNRGNKNDGKWR